MSKLLEWIITDPNIDPRFRRHIVDTPAYRVLTERDIEIRDKHHKDDLLDRADKKARERRFGDERMTWFGDI